MTRRRDPLLIILAGLGSVTSTLIAGVALARNGAPVIGSWCHGAQLPGTDGTPMTPRELLDLPRLGDLRFAGFDLADRTAYGAALEADVLSRDHIASVRPELEAVRAQPGVTAADLDGDGAAAAIARTRAAIAAMKRQHGASRAVMLVALSTEPFRDQPPQVRFDDETGRFNGTGLTPTLCYAIAAAQEGVPVANITPNRGLDGADFQSLAERHRIPYAGSDLKTGQTLLKTVLAPALIERGLQIEGWYSTNILGNRDGETLNDGENFKTKERSKLGVLDSIIDGHQEQKPHHIIRIDYYKPRGDRKETWDCIDFTGWGGYEMSIRLNFQCRDSILAAPLALDLALLLSACRDRGLAGPVPWLSTFFKDPLPDGDGRVVHAFPAQMAMLRDSVLDLARQPTAAQAV